MGAGISAVISPWLLRELGQFGVLLLFSRTNLLAWFLCSWLIPDTGIEALEDVFDRIDIETWFMFKYTARKILWRLTKPVHWLNFKRPLGSEAGLVRKPESSRDEFYESKIDVQCSNGEAASSPERHEVDGQLITNTHPAGGV